MKKSFSILILLFMFVSHLKSQDSSLALYRAVTPKNPGVAFTLATLIPGAGAMYNDQVTLGLGILVVEGALLSSSMVLINKYNTEEKYHVDANKSIANTLMISAGIIHFGQMVYAALYADQWNKKHGFGKKQTDRLKLAFSGNGLKANWAF